MIDEYFQALKARMELSPVMVGKVFDTLRMNPDGGLIRDNYVLLFSPLPVNVPQTRLAQVQTFADDVEFEVDLRVIAVNPAGVRLWASKVMQQLVGHQVAITGRQPAKLTVSGGSRVREDQSVKPFLYFSDLSLEWVSRAA